MTFFQGAARLGRAFRIAAFRTPEARLGVTALVLALLFATAQSALAHEFKVGSLTIEHPWSRATPPGAAVAAGYFVVTNSGSTPDKLISATSDVSGMVDIHKMAVKDGVMTMAPVEGGLEIPAGGSVALEPGSFHLMLMDLKHPLKKGEEFSGTLTFEKAGTVKVHFAVQDIASKAPAESSDGD